MPKQHALELVPDDAGLEVVRRDWQRLRDAGLPSQLDHLAPTNAPHVTVVSASVLPEDALDVARADAQRALDALGHEDVVLTLTELRRWDPDAGRVTTIAQARQ